MPVTISLTIVIVIVTMLCLTFPGLTDVTAGSLESFLNDTLSPILPTPHPHPHLRELPVWSLYLGVQSFF